MAHTFDVGVRWQEGFRGEAQPGGVAQPLGWSVPKDFGGPGGTWTPEHFLAAAVGSCVQATFLTMAQMSKLQISGYDSRATATMDKTPEGFRITSVALEVTVRVPNAADRERAQRLIDKAEKVCPISNAVKCGVTFQAAVTAESA